MSRKRRGKRNRDQPDLFDPQYRARRNDPETSVAWAARKNKSYGKYWRLILRALATYGPSTYLEVETYTGIHGAHTSSDLAKLKRFGLAMRLVDASGKKVKRNSCQLHVITAIGLECLQYLDEELAPPPEP